MATRCIKPANAPLDAAFCAAPSKSATHRALVAAALAEGVSVIREPLDAADTRATKDGLRALGVSVDERDRAWIVHGTAGAIPGGGTIALGASGTSARFLTAVAALGARPSILDGSPRLRERPMNELVRALRELGAAVDTASGGGLPLRVGGHGVQGGSIALPGERSSQFASALLLAASAFERGLRLTVLPPRVSFPYVILTTEILEAFGAVVTRLDAEGFSVEPQTLRAATLTIEGDYSSASYPFAAAAIVGGRVRIAGLRSRSAQPDARFVNDLASLGCRVSIDGDSVVVEGTGRVPAFSWNLADAPDLAPTAAVVALFAEGPCLLSGLHHLALKESDRLLGLRDNLRRMGAEAEASGGTLSIVPPARGGAHGAMIAVSGDHRIAMAFAVAGLAVPGVTIDDSEAVTKSYPHFWDDFGRLVRTGS
jgi:3-phosphoshikimate 1-carboxyvinyltransferase